ncbi:nuclear pore-associated protein 1-like [Hyaena hyaena]|uniref:nuclear pore-associated protein 1-like n=1 Tax=Hyaena hyaena TaxID=95912 RepID=UPI001920D15A|nr:nuclear pore-associated protein 1-like [Hyaena hyaena]
MGNLLSKCLRLPLHRHRPLPGRDRALVRPARDPHPPPGRGHPAAPSPALHPGRRLFHQVRRPLPATFHIEPRRRYPIPQAAWTTPGILPLVNWSNPPKKPVLSSRNSVMFGHSRAIRIPPPGRKLKLQRLPSETAEGAAEPVPSRGLPISCSEDSRRKDTHQDLIHSSPDGHVVTTSHGPVRDVPHTDAAVLSHPAPCCPSLQETSAKELSGGNHQPVGKKEKQTKKPSDPSSRSSLPAVAASSRACKWKRPMPPSLPLLPPQPLLWVRGELPPPPKLPCIGLDKNLNTMNNTTCQRNNIMGVRRDIKAACSDPLPAPAFSILATEIANCLPSSMNTVQVPIAPAGLADQPARLPIPSVPPSLPPGVAVSTSLPLGGSGVTSTPVGKPPANCHSASDGEAMDTTSPSQASIICSSPVSRDTHVPPYIVVLGSEKTPPGSRTVVAQVTFGHHATSTLNPGTGGPPILPVSGAVGRDSSIPTGGDSTVSMTGKCTGGLSRQRKHPPSECVAIWEKRCQSRDQAATSFNPSSKGPTPKNPRGGAVGDGHTPPRDGASAVPGSHKPTLDPSLQRKPDSYERATTLDKSGVSGCMSVSSSKLSKGPTVNNAGGGAGGDGHGPPRDGDTTVPGTRKCSQDSSTQDPIAPCGRATRVSRDVCVHPPQIPCSLPGHTASVAVASGSTVSVPGATCSSTVPPSKGGPPAQQSVSKHGGDKVVLTMGGRGTRASRKNNCREPKADPARAVAHVDTITSMMAGLSVSTPPKNTGSSLTPNTGGAPGKNPTPAMTGYTCGPSSAHSACALPKHSAGRAMGDTTMKF